jgi:meso-butanediol dehydrogenase/(S,S)-butanediol dehydrogenase/diacetyl reductase
VSLEDKVALVTGAGQGIGCAIALRLACEGADVAVNDVNPATLNQVARQVESLGRRSLELVADVSSSEQVTDMFERLLTHFGRLDVLVNNAGVGTVQPLLEFTEADWDREFDINVKGVFLCSTAAAQQMIDQGEGKIINAASVAGIRAAPYIVPYCASKAAVILLTQGLALELAPHGIRVNAYAPGIIDTPMTENTNRALAFYQGLSVEEIAQQRLGKIPLGRLGVPDDIAEVVAFLASDASDYITGQCIPVSGGLLMR